MKLNSVLGAALLASGAYAADDQKVIKDDAASPSAAETPSAPAVELPTFTVSLSRPAPGALIVITFDPAKHLLTRPATAQQGQGRFRRAVHRRLGEALEEVQRQEGHQG